MISMENMESRISSSSNYGGDVAEYILEYFEEYGAPKIEIILEKLFNTEDAEVFISALKVCRRFGYSDSVYWDYIINVAGGVEWDFEEYAKIAAISALGEFDGNERDISKVILLSINSKNPSVRDAVALAAQVAAHIPGKDRIIFGKHGNLTSEIPPAARQWIKRVSESNV